MVKIQRFYVPGLAIHSFLLYEGHRGILVDPARQIEPYLAFAAHHGIEITDLLETHVHADFLSGAPELKAALGGRPTIHCSAMRLFSQADRWIPEYADRRVYERDQIRLGQLHLEAFHTPGHTEEHLIWLVYDAHISQGTPQLAFTGDLLFAGSVGRPDLLGEEQKQVLSKELYQTLFDRMQPLPDSLEIYPSHGMGSLCGKEIGEGSGLCWGAENKFNPYLQPAPFDHWCARLYEDMPAVPDYFSRMKQLNVRRRALEIFQMPPRVTRIESGQACVLDVRHTPEFLRGHLKGALHIPLNKEEFPLWAGMLLDPGRALLLVLNDVAELLPAIEKLRLVGLDQVQGYCLAQDLHECVRGHVVAADSLQKKPQEYHIVDVRAPSEWQAGHLPEAHHLELAALPRLLAQLPRAQPIALICRTGTRSAMAASYLAQHGFEEVFSMEGGMQGLRN